MRVCFITYNELGVACIEELQALGAEIELVLSRPPDPSLSTHVDIEPTCRRLDLPLETVNSANSERSKRLLSEARPDFLFVIGWSELVDAEVLDVPQVTGLGMHPSPLPRGRGRAPITWSLIKGLQTTELSLFKLAPKADAGELVGQRTINIERTDDAQTLLDKVVHAGPDLIEATYPDFGEGTPQDDSQATWWPKRDPHHGLIDWTREPIEVYNWIRAQTDPYPGAYTFLDGRKVTIWAAEPPTGSLRFCKPGEILGRSENSLEVGTWEGSIRLTSLQVEEDAQISADELIDQYDVSVGDRFENARDRLSSELS